MEIWIPLALVSLPLVNTIATMAIGKFICYQNLGYLVFCVTGTLNCIEFNIEAGPFYLTFQLL